MEKINLSEPDGTRERWLAGALRESVALGRAISVSEYIRRAESFYEGLPKETRASAPPLGSAEDTVARMHRAVAASGFKVEDVRLPVRQPVTKEAQTRRGKG